MSDDRYPDHQTDAASLGTAAIGPLAPAGRATWEAIAELASVVPPDRWAVVGGQMVEIHAALAGVEPHRTTDDGDIAVDVRAHGRQAMRQVAAAFISAGFDTTFSPSGVTRFQHGLAKIDLLAPEGVGADVETVPPGHAVQAPERHRRWNGASPSPSRGTTVWSRCECRRCSARSSPRPLDQPRSPPSPQTNV